MEKCRKYGADEWNRLYKTSIRNHFRSEGGWMGDSDNV
jgi:hypothetical protein